MTESSVQTWLWLLSIRKVVVSFVFETLWSYVLNLNIVDFAIILPRNRAGYRA